MKNKLKGQNINHLYNLSREKMNSSFHLYVMTNMTSKI